MPKNPTPAEPDETTGEDLPAGPGPDADVDVDTVAEALDEDQPTEAAPAEVPEPTDSSDRKDRYAEVFAIEGTHIRAWYFKNYTTPDKWHLSVVGPDGLERRGLKAAPKAYIADVDEATKNRIVAELIAEIRAS